MPAGLRNTARTHLRLLFAQMGRRVVASLVMMLAGAALEAVGLLLLVLVIGGLGVDVSTGSPATLVAAASSLLALGGLHRGLEAVLAVYAVVLVLQATLFRALTILNMDIEYRFVAFLRTRLFDVVAHARWAVLAAARATTLTHAMTTEVDRAGLATYQLLWILTSALVMAVQVGLAMQVSVPLTLLVFASGAMLSLVLLSRLRRARRAGEAISEATGAIHNIAVEQVAGLKTIKSQATESQSIALFARGSDRVASAALSAVRAQADARWLFECGGALILAGLLVVALNWLGATPAMLLVLVFLFARLMPRVSAMQQGLHQYVTSLPAIAAVEAVHAQCAQAREDLVDRRPGPRLVREIAFDAVSFAYAPGTPLIERLTLRIAAGQTTALVGPSGSGKSTIADLLTGLLTPQAGTITVDGDALAPQLFAWRRAIGYVSQDSFFFHDTIRANLLLAAPEASDRDIEMALRHAAADFVFALPDGLNTVVGDRAVRLSGGERQRLALARALIRRPQLLILDEATSALDPPHERRVLDAIDRLRGQLTILIITHRVWTLSGVDVIHVIESGCLVETGRWDILRASAGSRFAALSLSGDAVARPRSGGDK